MIFTFFIQQIISQVIPCQTLCQATLLKFYHVNIIFEVKTMMIMTKDFFYNS